MHYMDSLDNQYAVVGRLYFATHFSSQLPVLGIDFAHIQCAAKCAYQSTANRGYEIIKGCSMRLSDVLGIDAIVGRHGPMNAEDYPICLTRQICVA
jgi:hypothetical protein